jgi:hypothetical protein
MSLPVGNAPPDDAETKRSGLPRAKPRPCPAGEEPPAGDICASGRRVEAFAAGLGFLCRICGRSRLMTPDERAAHDACADSADPRD